MLVITGRAQGRVGKDIHVAHHAATLALACFGFGLGTVGLLWRRFLDATVRCVLTGCAGVGFNVGDAEVAGGS